MPLHVRIDREIAILSNFARLMNDPRYIDAGAEVRALLDQGSREFIIELSGVRETGPAVIGLLTTLTRQIRRHGGEVVLAKPGPAMEQYIERMRMDSYWDIFPSVVEATGYFRR
jgi:anti-anti-sigma regulatory factor